MEIDTRKRKIEANAIPKLKAIFRNMANDAERIYRKNGNIDSRELANNYYPEFLKEIRDIMRKTTREFGFSLRQDLQKKGLNFGIDLELKEVTDPNVKDKLREVNTEIQEATTFFIANASEEQARFITQTNAREIALAITQEEVKFNSQKALPEWIIISRNIKINLLDKSVARSELIASQVVGLTESWVRNEEAEIIQDAELEIDSRPVEVLKTWVAILDSKTRPTHAIADFQQVGINQNFIVGGFEARYPRDENLPAEESINCLHPDSIVQIANPLKMTRRLYQGQMIVINDALGNKLTVTPNHPILTSGGWVAANLLKKGDYIICTNITKWKRFCDFNVNNIKTTVQQIFDSIGEVRSRTVRVGTVDMNFHGDVSSHNVNIISSNSLLRNTFNTFGIKNFDKLIFPSPDFFKGFFFSKCLIFQPLLSCWLFSSHLISLFNKSFFITSGSFRHSKKHCFTSISRFNASSFKSSINSWASRFKFFCHRFDRKASIKKGLAPRNLFVKSKINEISHIDFDGYVYNLETENNIYICNGIVNHNCRCIADYSNAFGQKSFKSAETYKPTDEMARNAARGLEWRKEYGRGGTAVGVARANQLKNKENLSESTVKRMHSYFSRHGNYRSTHYEFRDGEPTTWRIAWELWGSDAGRDWAKRIAEKLRD